MDAADNTKQVDLSNSTTIGVVIFTIFIIVIAIVIFFIIRKDRKNDSGGSCTKPGDCTGNLTCQTGTCREPTNGPCTTTSQCITGDICSSTGTSGTCITQIPSGLNKSCTDPSGNMPCSKIGQMCVNGQCKSQVGNGCSITSDCVSGLTCSRLGVCVSATPGTLGAPCISGNTCNTGLTCSESVCLTTSGGICFENTDCVSGVCSAGMCGGGGSGGSTRPMFSFINASISKVLNGRFFALGIYLNSNGSQSNLINTGGWFNPSSVRFNYTSTNGILTAIDRGITYVVNTQPSCSLQFVEYTSDTTATSTSGVPTSVAATATRWSFEIQPDGDSGRIISTIINGQRQILSFNFNQGTMNSTPQQGLPGQAILSPDISTGTIRSSCVTGELDTVFFQTTLNIDQ